MQNNNISMSLVDLLLRDPLWLTLEPCRENLRHRCPRNVEDCRFAHVDACHVVDGRVTACYDSLRGRCRREQCKFFHPPQHLALQVLANGRKYLEVKKRVLGQMVGAAGQQNVSDVYMGLPPQYMYPPPTIIPPTKSPQISPIASPIPPCETIPYPSMFLYKKSMDFKPALYTPTFYAAPGFLTPAAVPGLGMDLEMAAKVARGVYGQRIKKY